MESKSGNSNSARKISEINVGIKQGDFRKKKSRNREKSSKVKRWNERKGRVWYIKKVLENGNPTSGQRTKKKKKKKLWLIYNEFLENMDLLWFQQSDSFANWYF